MKIAVGKNPLGWMHLKMDVSFTMDSFVRDHLFITTFGHQWFQKKIAYACKRLNRKDLFTIYVFKSGLIVGHLPCRLWKIFMWWKERNYLWLSLEITGNQHVLLWSSFPTHNKTFEQKFCDRKFSDLTTFTRFTKFNDL